MTDLTQRIREYWNRQPCNILHGVGSPDTPEFYGAISERRYRVEPHIPEFAGFHHWQGKRVLEVGCGIGSDAEEFARHGAEYVGIDISNESLDVARRRFQVLDLEGNFYYQNAGEDMSHLGKFDLVYSYGVIHHFPNIEQTIDNICSVLKPDAEFRFMVYAKNSWKYAMIQKGLDQFEAQAGCPYAQAYTHDDIYNLLDSQVWRIERLRQSHCFMYNVEEYKQGRYELEPWFESMSESMREAVREYLGWHLLVKARKL
jgi:2-polyprenyl-3-methyl-5-hydroxy-6-metoxy-1,4-benzoquinol methylase